MTALSNFEKVQEFNKAMGVTHDMAQETIDLRLRLIREEFEELCDEFYWVTDDGTDTKPYIKPEYERIAKELADLLYVVYGAADAFDIPIDLVFADVHNSNMSKLGADGRPVRREDGKIMKGPNYRPPDLSYLNV